MRTYAQIQEELGKLVGLPTNLPVLYLLGDTGAGKTCLVRQLLGTTTESFPSVRRVRTTVAPTEFIITTNEPLLRAAFIIRPESEIAQIVSEILEQAVISAFLAVRAGEEVPDLSDVLGDSPDQRFWLRCFLDEQTRKEIAHDLSERIVPKIVAWANETFPNDDDNLTIIELGLEESAAPDLAAIRTRVLEVIAKQVKAKCSCAADAAYPETFAFETSDRSAFIQRLKSFLSVEEGSVSPAVEKARVRGTLRSNILPADLELVVVDGEGIGHDAREARVLSTRHFDYFYSSDAIILVEEARRPFVLEARAPLLPSKKTDTCPKRALPFRDSTSCRQTERVGFLRYGK